MTVPGISEGIVTVFPETSEITDNSFIVRSLNSASQLSLLRFKIEATFKMLLNHFHKQKYKDERVLLQKGNTQ